MIFLRAPRTALLTVLSLAGFAAGQNPEDCLVCHGDKINSSKFAATPHAAMGCGSCHAEFTGYPHSGKKTPDCSGCHSDVAGQHKRGIHAKVQQCTGCHGDLHSAVAHTEKDAPTHFTHIAEACAKCHAGITESGKVRRPVESYLQSAHARAVAAGKRGAVCSDCHGVHEIQRAADIRSPVNRANVVKTCGTCHGEVAAKFKRSVHGALQERGTREAPTCTDCHGEHRILKKSDPNAAVFTANIPTETCGRCHSDTRMTAKFGLERDRVPAFQESFHGLALRSGNLTAANCASCHGVHDILPSRDPESHVHQARLPETCGKCHPGAGERFALGPVHVAPASKAGSPAVYWIRIGYLWVIGLTIGGMVLHNLLDLRIKFQRPGPPRVTPPEQPERMSRSLRWQHGLVMLTFPTLAYTGFALKFPESWWAAPLLHFETAYGIRGLLHRYAAALLLAVMIWHMIQLAANRPARHCFRGMLPTYADARHLLATLGYYLGRRGAPHPPSHLTYIEKSEYWAFLWGMLVMSLTGFLLWFQNWSLRWLPGGSTDIATAVHYYEAILATLAILVWHGYWVVFDPDVYPMDTTWWSGKSPASRVAERQLALSGHPTTPETTSAVEEKPPDLAPASDDKGRPPSDGVTEAL